VAGLDFLAVTDHIEYLSWMEFNAGQQKADSLTVNGSFIGFYGYEWTSNTYGHCDVFHTNEMISASSSSLYPGGWDVLTDFVRDHPPAFAQFNHPGRSTAFNNWDSFKYLTEVKDSVFPLIEFQNIQQATTYYELALSKGWHLTPVWNQDNHLPDWGTKNTGRAGIWADTLTRASLISAILHRRTFATMDSNASIWIESDTIPMGSEALYSSSIVFRVLLQDADNESWQSVQLVSDIGMLANITWTGNLDSSFVLMCDTVAWIFARATQTDGDMIWSAPVFFHSPTGMDQNQVLNDKGEYRIIMNPASLKVLMPENAGPDVRIMISNVSGQPLMQKNSGNNTSVEQEYGGKCAQTNQPDRGAHPRGYMAHRFYPSALYYGYSGRGWFPNLHFHYSANHLLRNCFLSELFFVDAFALLQKKKDFVLSHRNRHGRGLLFSF
jgi:hypothetical protein